MIWSNAVSGNLYYACDLGTTDTLIACFRKRIRGSKVELCPVCYGPDEPELQNPSPTDLYILPSALYREAKPGGEVCWHAGLHAQRFARENSDFRDNYYTNAKAGVEDGQVYSHGVTARDIICQLLVVCFRSVKQDVFQKFGDEAEERFQRCGVCISNPLATDPNFVRLLKEAAYEAAEAVGFGQAAARIQFCEEPTAALAAFIDREFKRVAADPAATSLCPIGRDAAALVIDLGGGTSDMAVRPFRVDAKTGIITFLLDAVNPRTGRRICHADNTKMAFGGMDFDDLITVRLVHRFSRAYAGQGGTPFCFYEEGESLNLADGYDSGPVFERILSRASEEAQRVKRHFSAKDPDIYFSGDITSLLSPDDTIRFHIEVTQDEYSAWVRTLIDRESALRASAGKHRNCIEEIVYKTLENAGVEKMEDLDFVYLTGGMSHVTEIRNWVRDNLINGQCGLVWAAESNGNDVDNCLTDIVKGIAWLENPSQPDNMLMYIANAVFLDVQEGLPEELIARSTPYPTEGEKTARLPFRSSVGIPLRLLTGPSVYSEDLKVLMSGRLADHVLLSPDTRLQFAYALDRNKQISLSATYRDAYGKEHTEQIQHTADAPARAPEKGQTVAGNEFSSRDNIDGTRPPQRVFWNLCHNFERELRTMIQLHQSVADFYLGNNQSLPARFEQSSQFQAMADRLETIFVTTGAFPLEMFLYAMKGVEGPLLPSDDPEARQPRQDLTPLYGQLIAHYFDRAAALPPKGEDVDPLRATLDGWLHVMRDWPRNASWAMLRRLAIYAYGDLLNDRPAMEEELLRILTRFTVVDSKAAFLTLCRRDVSQGGTIERMEKLIAFLARIARGDDDAKRVYREVRYGFRQQFESVRNENPDLYAALCERFTTTNSPVRLPGDLARLFDMPAGDPLENVDEAEVPDFIRAHFRPWDSRWPGWVREKLSNPAQFAAVKDVLETRFADGADLVNYARTLCSFAGMKNSVQGRDYLHDLAANTARLTPGEQCALRCALRFADGQEMSIDSVLEAFEALPRLECEKLGPTVALLLNRTAERHTAELRLNRLLEATRPENADSVRHMLTVMLCYTYVEFTLGGNFVQRSEELCNALLNRMVRACNYTDLDGGRFNPAPDDALLLQCGDIIGRVLTRENRAAWRGFLYAMLRTDQRELANALFHKHFDDRAMTGEG